MRTPDEAERDLLDEGGLRRLYDGPPVHRIERHVVGPHRFEVLADVSH